MLHDPYLQNNQYTTATNFPRKPAPRASLSRFSDEMPQRKIQYNHKFEDSYSSNSEESSTEEDSKSYARSSLSTSSSPDIHNKTIPDNVRKRQSAKDKSLNVPVNQSGNETIEIYNRSLNGSVNKSTKHPKRNELPSTSFLVIACLIIFTIVFVLIPNVYKTSARENNLNKHTALKHVAEEIRSLKKEFRNQENKIWAEIYSGIIEVINNPQRPSIFVLFADQTDLMNCLALTIGELGRMAFGTEESLKVKPAELENDTGEVIEKLRSVIPERKSVIFWDFLSINDKALNAFHFICDRENPLVQEAIYVITVKAEGYIDSTNPLEFIENKLKSNLTGRIKEDSLMPLITRITDGPIISVKPEVNMQCRFKNTINYW